MGRRSKLIHKISHIRRSHASTSIALAGLLLSLTAGCDQGPQMVPVTGTITLEGKPLPTASVMYVLKAGGPPVTAVTDEQGKYNLSTTVEGDGALEGDYQVAIVAYRVSGVSADPASDPSVQLPGAMGGERVVWIAPMRYSKLAESGLTATVTAEHDNVIDFDLKSK
jgi:hypothetical protein